MLKTVETVELETLKSWIESEVAHNNYAFVYEFSSPEAKIYSKISYQAKNDILFHLSDNLGIKLQIENQTKGIKGWDIN